MARRGEHFPAQAATKCPLADSGVVSSLPARLATIFSPTGAVSGLLHGLDEAQFWLVAVRVVAARAA